MKSIKEKAEEVFKIEEYDSLETKLQRRKMRVCYEHGANYVLECIEKTIPSSDDVLENHTKCKSAIFRLQTIIEQLKK